ncbi:MAG: cell envelope integrity EipB family protein [Acetobacteraceae bacterium]
MRRLAVLAAFLLLAVPATAAVPPIRLAAHQALYRLTLADGRGQVIGAIGTMGYEVTDACRAWSVRQRLDVTLTNTEGDTTRLVSEYVTTEAKDGLSLRFRTTQNTDGAISSRTAGEARLDHAGGPGVADYTQPEVKQVALPPGTLFPMAHTAALIRAAEEGRKFFTLPVFDGTDDNGAELSSIVPLSRSGPTPGRWPALATLPSVVVHIAFFGSSPAKMLPNYEVGMRYWTNGVADDLHMDFGDFVMSGKLIGFRPLPSRC